MALPSDARIVHLESRMAVAWLFAMKLVIKLFAVAGVVGAGLFVARWYRQRFAADPVQGARGTDAVPMSAAAMGPTDLPVVGISEVDPQPLTQIAGEGIDPDVPVPPRVR